MIKQRPRQNEERQIAETTYSRGIAYQGWGDKKTKKTNKQKKSHTPDPQVCKLQLQFSPPPNDAQDYK
jgi:hypothetical protein